MYTRLAVCSYDVRIVDIFFQDLINRIFYQLIKYQIINCRTYSRHTVLYILLLNKMNLLSVDLS